MRTGPDGVIDAYMKELQAELRGFPASRKREILEEVREHISQARSEMDSENEAAIRTVLDRLGDPSDIASAARQRLGMPRPRAGVFEGLAVIALVVPFIGWLVGTILVWLSRVWTNRDKWIATLTVPTVWLLFFLGSVATGSSVHVRTSGPGARVSPGEMPMAGPPMMDRGGDFTLAWVFPFLLILVPIAVAIYLAVRARNLTDEADAAELK